jgi:replicative DNA helicase
MSRMLAAGAHASYGEITRHNMSQETEDAVHNFAALYPEFQSNLLIDDQTDHTLESIMSIARAQKRRGLDFVFIDYVQLLNSTKDFGARYEELGMMSKTLHQMANKLDIAILLAAQSGRQADNKDHIPTMSDLRESGNLEADADVVMMLSRAYDERMPDMPLINISIVKNRTGEGTGIIRLPEHFEQARLGN